MMFIWTTGSRGLFLLRGDASRFGFVLLLEAVSRVEKRSAVLKRAMTEKHQRWPKKDRYSKTNSHWWQPAGREVGQSSHDKWRSTKPQGKWKEISAEIDAVVTTVRIGTVQDG